MDRRDFLKSATLFGAGLVLGGKHVLADMAINEEPIYAGWEQNPRLRAAFIRSNKYPFLNQLDQEIRGTGKGKQALLWKCFEEVTGGPLIPHFQEIGDCVGQSYGLGVDILTAVQISLRKSPQRWVAKAATEIIYAGGRIEIGTQQYGRRWGGDGLTGVCAAEFVKKYGVLLRQKYLDGKYNFTRYSGELAQKLGRLGVPDELEPLCKLHPVGWTALVQSWEEARDCLYNGYPVVLCSSQGFRTRFGRDKDGFLSPSRYPWYHSMLLAGMDDESTRPGGLIINSWGSDWVSGPKRLGQPEGSFWADAAVINRMCQQGDTIALSCYAGYPRQDYSLW